MVLIVVVHTLSRVWFFVIPRTAAHWAGQGSFTISWGLLKLRSIESVMPCKHLILCRLLLLLPSIFASIRVFSSESVLQIRWTKYWCFSFSISPSNEYSGLISFWIDCFDLLAVQGTLKSLLNPQFESINSSVLSLLYSLILTSIHDYWKHHQFSSVQFSCSVVSNPLWLHEPQHSRPPCPSPTPGVHPNSCPLSRWCHPTISSSVVPISSRFDYMDLCWKSDISAF